MRVFMSWSGERSRQVGELFDQWLQCVIQAVDPWMSTKDIDRGALWFTEINNQLKEISVGIIVLTKENKDKPWILFEAGALAKGLSTNRVCVILVDLESSEVRDPLAQFNLTLPNKDGIWQLVSTLNSSLQENALKEKVLSQVFETYWPQFERRFNEILNSTPDSNLVEEKEVNSNELLFELINNTRLINRRLHDLEMLSDKPKNQYNINQIRKRIRELIQYGMEEEEIINALSSDAPVGLIKNLMYNLTREKINEVKAIKL